MSSIAFEIRGIAFEIRPLGQAQGLIAQMFVDNVLFATFGKTPEDVHAYVEEIRQVNAADAIHAATDIAVRKGRRWATHGLGWGEVFKGGGPVRNGGGMRAEQRVSESYAFAYATDITASYTKPASPYFVNPNEEFTWVDAPVRVIVRVLRYNDDPLEIFAKRVDGFKGTP